MPDHKSVKTPCKFRNKRSYEIEHVLSANENDQDRQQLPANMSDNTNTNIVSAYQGTIVILKPNKAQTLKLVTVLTVISTSAVKVTPTLECTFVICCMDQVT